MTDHLREAHFLRAHYVSDEMLKDKDTLKNRFFEDYSRRVKCLFAFPMAFQLWQICLINRPEMIRQYNQVRTMKALTLAGAIGFGVLEKVQMDKRFTFLNRYYPEPTELQTKLKMQAILQKLRPQEVEAKDPFVMDHNTQRIYEQMYQLPIGPTGQPWQDLNPAVIKKH